MNPATSEIPPIPGYVAGAWRVDGDLSTIGFSLRQIAAKVRGRFTRYEVAVTTSESLRDSFVTAEIELDSIDTGNQRRDGHLLSSGLLKVEEHPTMSYRSTGMRRNRDGWTVDGELTLYGTTRTVPLAITASDFREDATGDRRVTFLATAELRRRDFGVKIPMAGGLIGDKVSISLEIHALPRMSPA